MILKYAFVLLTVISFVSFALIFLHRVKSSTIIVNVSSIDALSSSSWTLKTRNEIRFQHLINEFSSFINISSFETNSFTSKTFIYSCRSFCGGWGDRLRGIFSVYMLALVSNRRFLIDMSYPCDIHRVLQPHRIDWRFSSNFQTKNRTKLTINTMASWQKEYRIKMINLIKNENFVELWSSYDDIFMTTNADYLSIVLQNRHYPIQLKNLFGRFKLSEISLSRLFPFLFDFLFQPKLSVRQRVDVILGAAIDRRLICFHIRLGKNPSNPFDHQFQQRENTTRSMIDYVDRHLWNQSESLIFVTSDSSQAIADVLYHYPTNAMTIVGPLLHIDRFDRRTKYLEDGFQKVFADFYLLGECQILIASHSGFSSWANRRRTNFTSNYFIFNEKSQKISS